MEPVRSGLDMPQADPSPLDDAQQGLVTCSTGVTRQLRSTADVLHRADDAQHL